jgi:hypothetical protein
MVKAQSGPTNPLVAQNVSKRDSESCSGAKICCSKERPGSSPGHPNGTCHREVSNDPERSRGDSPAKRLAVEIMDRTQSALRYGAIGLICGVGSIIAYDVASSIVPTPNGFGSNDALSMSALELEWAAGIVCVVATLYSLTYGVALSIVQILTGVTTPGRRVTWAIALYVTLIQMIATFCTDAFTRTGIGWSLDQSISIPIAIAGATVPGLVVAIFLVVKWCGRPEVIVDGSASSPKRDFA